MSELWRGNRSWWWPDPADGRHSPPLICCSSMAICHQRRTVASADYCGAVDHSHQASSIHYRLHELHILAEAAALFVNYVFISAFFEVVVIHHRRCCFLIRPLPSWHQSVIRLRRFSFHLNGRVTLHRESFYAVVAVRRARLVSGWVNVCGRAWLRTWVYITSHTGHPYMAGTMSTGESCEVKTYLV